MDKQYNSKHSVSSGYMALHDMVHPPLIQSPCMSNNIIVLVIIIPSTVWITHYNNDCEIGNKV